ncbi:uncharacterized protein LOC116021856 [Ipomoea triloba]|uniref:uncharacterized protein LOC116021856 n=1 Tax=Ipomoea triloba TaxID=35885 RepID=UPI00125CF826|nr:uncharacterized protein LOC116021856 [Ipomoea triloba]
MSTAAIIPAQVSTARSLGSQFTSSSPFSSLFPARRQRRTLRLRCALLSEKRRESRRLVSVSLAAFLHWFSLPKEAVGGSIFDKYMKRKKLDPLEAYVPAVILAQLQIKQLGKSLEVDQPKFADCRNVLRSGPAASLRVNIRAVAQYASDDGNGELAFSEVDQCLRSLEELDSLFLRASRNERDASTESMKGQITAAINALDELLKTVPANVLDQGRAIADAYVESLEEDEAPGNQDPNLKQLESIL